LGGSAGEELSGQRLEFALAAGEEGVATVGQVAAGREIAGFGQGVRVGERWWPVGRRGWWMVEVGDLVAADERAATGLDVSAGIRAAGRVDRAFLCCHAPVSSRVGNPRYKLMGV
jgi:hypothetical protein